MAASLVYRKLGTKCHSVLRLSNIELRSAKYVAFNVERILSPSTCAAVYSYGHACLSTSSGRLSEPVTNKSESTAALPNNATDSKIKPRDTDLRYVYKEQYIPITRQSLLRFLLQEKSFFTESELKLFPSFVLALDSTLVNKYHTVLTNLQSLFDPINPDKDTLKTREWTRNDKLDNEFWLLQQLQDVMKKANFHELPAEKVEQFLRQHKAQEGVIVSVDPSRYDVLKFWVLGHEQPELHVSFGEKIVNKIFRSPPRQPMQYFKRVVVALRLKKDSKLILKAFKEIPLQRIEMLLPDGKVRMSLTDKSFLAASGGLAGLGILAKAVTVLANINVDWPILLSLVTGSMALPFWYSYQNRKNAYLIDVSRTLYFKNITNNKGLLTLLVDRAEDESLKETLLTYAFLLQTLPESIRKSPTADSSSSKGLTKKELEEQVSKWVDQRTGVQLEFNATEAVLILKNLGLLTEKNDRLHVLTLEAAARILPQSLPSVIARRATEADITEGYDRDEYLETEAEYKTEEKQTSRYGWF
ncbi:transmembrane protein 143-like [Biomphalaria glabrata]|uniref:Transmembrane protein 143-like n=1 Tax=Biomphalaria glabrata TaxID=6526 RepID=A0A9U8DVL1_BIOGL|nr:transmembrane protein 143-like [Biomphalaria glabrata]